MKGAGTILVVSSLIGIAVNISFLADVLRGEKTFNPETRVEAILQSTDVTTIALEEAKSAFDAGSALFIDSRNAEDYTEGHIAGALNIPWENFHSFKNELEERILWDGEIITYCGGSCDSSAELAATLLELGYGQVKVFLNGWPMWVEAQYPVDSFE